HSPQMDCLRDELLDELKDVRPRPARIPICSTVNGDFIDGLEMTAEYWARNLRNTVLFGKGIELLSRHEHDVFIEASPHPILVPSIGQVMKHYDRSAVVLGSLRREQDERASMLASLAQLWALGQNIAWAQISAGHPVPVPPYPWQRERFWLEGK